jgi:hypothetical protein
MKLLSFFIIIFIMTLFFSGFFLDNGLGLKGMQVAGAYTANPQGAEALFWNVANLANQDKINLYTVYNQNLYWDINEYDMLFSLPVENFGTIAFAYKRSSVDDIMYTTSNTVIDRFSLIDDVYIKGFAKKLFLLDDSIGISFKNINKHFDNLGTTRKSYQSIDLAYQINFLLFNLGFVAEDFYVSEESDLNNKKFRLGLNTKILDIDFSIDAVYSDIFKKSFINYGLIFSAIPFIDIKGGYSEYYKNSYAGLSFTMLGLNVDYLFSNPEIGVIHKLGFGIEF